MSRILLFILPFVILAGSVVLSNFVSKLFKTEEEPEPDNGAMITVPFAERAQEIIAAYADAYNSNDSRVAEGRLSPGFVECLRSDLAMLARSGLRKEVEIKLTPLINRITNGYYYRTWERYDSCYEVLRGSYRVRLIDNASGKVLHETNYPRAIFYPTYSEVATGFAGGERCAACNGEMAQYANIRYCTACDTRVEDVEHAFMLSSLKVIPVSVEVRSKKVEWITYAFMALLPILSFFAPAGSFLNALLIFGNLILVIVMLLGVYSIVQEGLNKKKVEKKEKMPYTDRLIDCCGHVTALLFRYRDNQPADAANILTPAAYQAWCREYGHEGYYVLECRPHFVLDDIGKSFVRDGYNHVNVNGFVYLTVMDKNRTVMQMDRPLQLRLTRLQDESLSGVFTCDHCGRYTYLTDDSKCPLCGAPYSRRDHDWQVEWLNLANYFDYGGKTYGIYQK